MLVALTLGLTAALAGPAEVTAAAAGSWRFGEDRAVYDARTAADVETSAESVNFAIRGLARRELSKLVPPCPRFSFRPTDQHFVFECEGKNAVTAPWNGTGTATRDDGKQIPLVSSTSGTSVTVQLNGEGGGKTMVFQFADGGLTVHQTVTSPRLPTPLSWSARYVR